MELNGETMEIIGDRHLFRSQGHVDKEFSMNSISTRMR